MKILIADDDPVSRTLMLAILNSAKAGYELLPVEDGSRAWTVLESNPDIKLAIVDLMMPGMTGVEWLNRVRADARFSELPVIICTVSSDRQTVTTVAARGISHFLVKPFSRATVLEKVAQVCPPAVSTVPVVHGLVAARERFDIDRDTHRELLGYYVRIADMWATEARRSTEYPHVRALSIRAGDLKQVFAKMGAAAVSRRFEEAEESLSVYRTKPVSAYMAGCLRTAQQLGENVQPEIDRLREMLDTLG